MHRVDMVRTGLANDVVIANHVLDHIPDDRRSMGGVWRLLRRGGLAPLTVPANASRQQTYENPAAATPAERHAHFGAVDHVRYYGLDFADRLAEAGFAVSTFRQTLEEEVKCGLLRHEWLYVATKPDRG